MSDTTNTPFEDYMDKEVRCVSNFDIEDTKILSRHLLCVFVLSCFDDEMIIK